MEQNLPIPQSVKIRQNIAAGLLVLTDIYWLIISIGIPLPTPLISAIIGVVCAVAWGLLFSTAANKATRVASIIIIVFVCLSALLTLIGGSIPATTTAIFHCIKPLTSIYAYSILLKGNSNIDTTDRTWLGMMMLSPIGVLILNGYYFGFGFLQLSTDYAFNLQYNLAFSTTWKIWNIIYYILIAIAEFRVAKCAAFAGNYTTEPAPKGTYSPINKYFAALLIAVSITLCLLWLIYSNLESIESIF